jgi:hypothetical protein
MVVRDLCDYSRVVGHNIATGDLDKYLALVLARYRSFNNPSVGLEVAYRK